MTISIKSFDKYLTELKDFHRISDIAINNSLKLIENIPLCYIEYSNILIKNSGLILSVATTPTRYIFNIDNDGTITLIQSDWDINCIGQVFNSTSSF